MSLSVRVGGKAAFRRLRGACTTPLGSRRQWLPRTQGAPLRGDPGLGRETPAALGFRL